MTSSVANLEQTFRQLEGECASFGIRYEDLAERWHENTDLPASSARADDVDRVRELLLVIACERGNSEAWKLFLDQYRAPLQKIVRRFQRNGASDEWVDDFLVQTLIESREGRSSLGRFRGQGSLLGWLSVVARRTCVRENRLRERDQQPLPPEESDDETASRNPILGASDKEIAKAVARALRLASTQMTPLQKAVFRRWFFGRLSQRSIADKLNADPSRVCRVLRRSIEKMRESMVGDLRSGLWSMAIQRGHADRVLDQLEEVHPDFQGHTGEVRREREANPA